MLCGFESRSCMTAQFKALNKASENFKEVAKNG
jgi:hypothetical protein